MLLKVPARGNDKLCQVVDRANQDAELEQLWKCVNINAVDRSGISDHGATHVRIVANAALKLLRLLTAAGIKTSVEVNYGLTQNDAEVIVVLAACLHDLGIAIHRDLHEQYSLVLAVPKLRQILDGVYDETQRTIITAEILHAIVAHRWNERCLTIEAGVVKVADALDMTQGRSRIPFEAGETNIHSVSAAAVDLVSLQKGERLPIRVEITMNNSAGIFQLDELLKRKLRHSSIAPYVEVVAKIEGEAEKRLIEFYAL